VGQHMPLGPPVPPQLIEKEREVAAANFSGSRLFHAFS